MVIDRGCVASRPLGATAWTTIKGHEYQDIDSGPADDEPDVLAKVLLQHLGLGEELGIGNGTYKPEENLDSASPADLSDDESEDESDEEAET